MKRIIPIITIIFALTAGVFSSSAQAAQKNFSQTSKAPVKKPIIMRANRGN